MTAVLLDTPAEPSDDRRLRAARARLLARIGRRYRTVTHRFRFGALEVPFTRVEDPDVVLDEVAEAEDRLERVSGRRADGDALHLPYWAELWDSAVGMGIYLAQGGLLPSAPEMATLATDPALAPAGSPASPAALPPPRVLDLGCGMGLAGTVAALLGAPVLFADLEPPALLFARLNSLAAGRRVRTRRLNWQTDRLGERFDLVLGADILYERKQWDYLEPFWRAHLAPGGRVLLGEPGRQTGDLFVAWIADRGWDLEQVALAVPTRPTPVRVFRVTPR